MPVDQILSMLISERDKLTRAIEALQGTPRSAKPTPTIEAKPAPNHKLKRVWTDAMRLAARRRAKAVWARRRKATGKKG